MQNLTVLDHFILFKKDWLLYLFKLSQGKKNAYLYLTQHRTLQFWTILFYSKKIDCFIYLNFHKARKMHIYI